MYELVQAGTNSYYIQSPAKIGIFRLNDKDVCLIDSGSDKDAGRKVRQILDKNGWQLTAIYHTHSHADHIGGSQYLQRNFGCSVYAPDIECDFTNHPILEPAFLYGGFPPKDLRHKFLLAQESSAALMPQKLPDGLTPIPLPGHSFSMTGYRTKDDVVYLADCLSSKETLEKYQIGFLYDVAAYLDTLHMVKNMQAALFVPAHAQAVESIAELAQANIDKVQEIAGKIIGLCKEPICFEHLLQQLFKDYGLKMNFEQYVLVGSTVRSYLSWLKDNGQLTVLFENGYLLWQVFV